MEGHDQLLFCSDNKTGLKAIIAIHDTTLGPALGGTRMWCYNNEVEALNDVLRLSRGMTYKNAISDLALGGGKAVIIGDSKTMKSEALFRRFGRFVDSLAGNYIAEDVGISPSDMVWVSKETDHVVGLPDKSEVLHLSLHLEPTWELKLVLKLDMGQIHWKAEKFLFKVWVMLENIW